MNMLPNKAIVRAIPNAVPEYLAYLLPMLPSTTGKAEARPKPIKVKAKTVIVSDFVIANIMQPNTAIIDDNARM